MSNHDFFWFPSILTNMVLCSVNSFALVCSGCDAVVMVDWCLIEVELREGGEGTRALYPHFPLWRMQKAWKWLRFVVQLTRIFLNMLYGLWSKMPPLLTILLLEHILDRSFGSLAGLLLFICSCSSHQALWFPL